MSDLTELIKAERSAREMAGTFDNANGTGRIYLDAQAATDAAIANPATLSPAPLTINRDVRERAAFAVYRLRYPESNAESFETVGLPIVLACREMVDAVIAHLSAQTVEGEGR